MKAERLRKTIFAIIMASEDIPPQHVGKQIDEDIAELERLAEIGKATEELISEKKLFYIKNIIRGGYNMLEENSFISVDQLIELSESLKNESRESEEE